MTGKRENERRVRKHRDARVMRMRRRRAFDESFEDEERDIPLGGDDKPPAGQ